MGTWIITVKSGATLGVDDETLGQMTRDRSITPDTQIADEDSQMAYRAGDIPALFSPKSWLVGFVLSVFVGYLGVDRFYTGRAGLGVLKLLTAGGGGLWWIIDAILFSTKSVVDRQGRRIADS